MLTTREPIGSKLKEVQTMRYVPRMVNGYAFCGRTEVMVTNANEAQFVSFQGDYAKFRIGGKYYRQLLVACEQTTVRAFDDSDVEGGLYPRIYANREDLLSDPLWYHVQGLSQTATGYGAKLTNAYKVFFGGRFYRVYTTIYGNAGSSWFVAKGRKIYLS
jgi:hypothetical protein